MMDIESAVKTDPSFTSERQLALRTSLGLDVPEIKALLERSEFVSLGGFCGVSSALESLGLRRSAGPFDWVRSPVEGILHCFESGFEDFLTFSSTRMEHGLKVFESSQWGGSFWHHEIEEPSVRDQFSRRIERLVGAKKVQDSAPRFFIRVANSKAELSLASKLLATLQRKFYTSPVYLLVITDMQKQDRLMHIEGTSSHLLFCCVHENLWLQSSTDSQAQMHRCSQTYAACIGAAVRFWFKKGVIAPMHEDGAEIGAGWVGEATFEGWMESFDGGDPAKQSYSPLFGLCWPPGYIGVPAGAGPGALVKTSGFGRDLEIRVPEGGHEGRVLELRLTGDMLSVELVPDDALVAAMAIIGVTTTAAAAAATDACTGVPTDFPLRPGFDEQTSGVMVST